MKIMNSTYNWSDLNPYPNGDSISKGLDAIQDAVFNAVFIQTRGRLFNSQFGADIERLLFDPMDEITAGKIRSQIKKAITRWDPRLQVSMHSTVTPDYDNNLYNIVLVVKILGYESGGEEDGIYSFKFHLTHRG